MWRHNYIEAGRKVFLYKPSIDTREEFLDENHGVIESRIGLQEPCRLIHPQTCILAERDLWENFDVIMVDEAQFLSPEQVEELEQMVLEGKTVICFGLKTDFLQNFFPGSRRLMELATDIRELKTVCTCGKKATINARMDENGHVITSGSQILIGGNDKYQAMCKFCYEKKKQKYLKL